MEQRDAAGLEYLDLVTSLLQRARVCDPDAGLWEAADLQWWWRRDQHPDPANATFWIDAGMPVAAVVFTNWGTRWGCDVIAVTDHAGSLQAELWSHALHRIAKLQIGPIETTVRDDDGATAALLEAAGFTRDADGYMTCSMAATERAAPKPLADGYRLFSTAERAAVPHQMTPRNGSAVAEHLRECSLYDPDLDLYVVAPDGDVAGYGLFWADPVTGVGLVEPMRTEDAHQGRGLAGHLFRTGLDRLAQRGCTTLRVTHEEANVAAQSVYIGAGFHPHTRSWTYRRQEVMP